MKRFTLGTALCGLVSGIALAAGAAWHVQSITYQGKEVISGTFTLPTGFTVHRGDTFTLKVQGAAGTELAAEVFLLPVTAPDQAASAMSGTLLGKPRAQKIGPGGAVDVVWQVAKDAKPGVRQLRLVSPPAEKDPFIAAAGDDRTHWVGIFTVAP